MCAVPPARWRSWQAGEWRRPTSRRSCPRAWAPCTCRLADAPCRRRPQDREAAMTDTTSPIPTWWPPPSPRREGDRYAESVASGRDDDALTWDGDDDPTLSPGTPARADDTAIEPP